MTPDEEASQVYRAHGELRRLLALADESPMRQVRWFESWLTMPIELRFHDVASVRRYVNTVVAAEGLPPCGVHPKEGADSAFYYSAAESMFVPADDPEGQWTMRQIPILHELAHHVEWVRHRTGGHGDVFRRIYLELVERYAGEECALVLRTGFNSA